MDMSGKRRIQATRQEVWDALNDPEALKASIPGCESMERVGENELQATVAMKIGPISARFSGKVSMSEIDPLNSYVISGEGQGGVAGFAMGNARVRLSDENGGTLLTYAVRAQVGGKIAQLGARLIDASAKQMSEIFFDRFSARLAPAAVVVPLAVDPHIVVSRSSAFFNWCEAHGEWVQITGIVILMILIGIFLR